MFPVLHPARQQWAYSKQGTNLPVELSQLVALGFVRELQLTPLECKVKLEAARLREVRRCLEYPTRVRNRCLTLSVVDKVIEGKLDSDRPRRVPEKEKVVREELLHFGGRRALRELDWRKERADEAARQTWRVARSA